jgi:flagellar biogenesis protein FliO
VDSLYSIFAVLFVLALLGGTLALLRKRGAAAWSFPSAAGKARRIELVERVTMGPNHALHLINIGGRSVLVATSPGGCQLLQMPGPSELCTQEVSR